MNCSETRELLDAYVDGELGLADRQALTQHVESCVACATLETRLHSLRTRLQANARRSAPAGLEQQIQASLQASAVASERRNQGWWLPATVAALLSAAVTATLVVMLITGPTVENFELRELTAAHIRSLMENNLTHIASSDRHSVKPWFNGKLDFAPLVMDFKDAGFALQGGRLDYLHERSVAALVYRRREHLINLFIWPTPVAPSAAGSVHDYHGYHLLQWQKAGLAYCLVSDLNPQELQVLSRLLVNVN